MNISIILAHPNPGSFNHAIATTSANSLLRNGHEVVFHDLCQEQFPPLLTVAELQKDARLEPVVARHCREIASADGIIIVHPNWWGMPPAILKGWIDRVLRMEVAYRFVANDKGEGVPVGLLKAEAAIVFNTANTPDDRERTVFGDPLETLWKRCVFDLCGVKDVQRRTFSVVVTSTPEDRARWLAEVREIVGAHFPSAKN
jgi:NAD(P)H dehydrogenase (quinone)